ncbi:hypothetical protein J3459_006196 [Metarhizium acridum]|uniref:uncharacterized protein n=1 Tax=Metarhizium acridum TaxID=92637 RepID=UPI001C6CED79|nr:hypothetical protein J3458_005373 [Metarhizium acridum]KAG8427938.1 hypothetical protein J3459_006196 [Metarhizium acridum]
MLITRSMVALKLGVDDPGVRHSRIHLGRFMYDMPFRLNTSSILNSSLYFHWKVVNRKHPQNSQHNLEGTNNLFTGSGLNDLTYFVELSRRPACACLEEQLRL